MSEMDVDDRPVKVTRYVHWWPSIGSKRSVGITVHCTLETFDEAEEYLDSHLWRTARAGGYRSPRWWEWWRWLESTPPEPAP